MINIFQHGHIKISLPAWGDKGQDLKIQRVKDRDIRGNADAEIIGNKPCGNLILINLKSNIRVLSDAFKKLVNDLAETAPLLEDDLLVWKRFLQMYLAFLSKRMFRWNDDDQILLGNRNKFDQRFVIKFGTETDIIFLLFQSGEDITGKHLITEQIEMDLFSLIGIKKAADDLWHKVNTQSSEKSHIDLSFSFSCKLETVYRGIQPVQGLFHILQKRLAIFGERNIPSVFFK